MRTISFDIDLDRFREVVLPQMFSDTRTILRELIQNARRAGATEIRISYPFIKTGDDPWVLVIEDNGTGEKDLSRFLTVAATGWSESIVRDETPAGMGFLSVLMCANECVVESLDQRMKFACSAVIGGDDIDVETVEEPIVGTRITCTFLQDPRLSSDDAFEDLWWQKPNCFLNDREVEKKNPWAMTVDRGKETEREIVVDATTVDPEQRIIGFETEHLTGYIRWNRGPAFTLWEGFRIHQTIPVFQGGGFSSVVLCKTSALLRLPDRAVMIKGPKLFAEYEAVTQQILDRVVSSGHLTAFREMVIAMDSEEARKKLNEAPPVYFKVAFGARYDPEYRIDLDDMNPVEEIPEGAVVVRSPTGFCDHGDAQVMDYLASRGLLYTTDGHRLDMTHCRMDDFLIEGEKAVIGYVSDWLKVKFYTCDHVFLGAGDRRFEVNAAVGVDPDDDGHLTIYANRRPENLDKEFLDEVWHRLEVALCTIDITDRATSDLHDEINSRLDSIHAWLISFGSWELMEQNFRQAVQKGLAPFKTMFNVDNIRIEPVWVEGLEELELASVNFVVPRYGTQPKTSE